MRGQCLLAAAVVVVASAVAHAQQTVGLFLNTEDAQEGFTLFAPQNRGTTYLINNEGRQVHTWDSAYRPGNTAYLLPNGNLLRTAKDAPPDVTRFGAGGFGGRVEQFTWDGTPLWSYLYASNDYRQHHDIEPLPNGNVLMIAWELKTQAEALAAGRDPALISQGELWPEHVIEVQPVGLSGGVIVWEWHAWDHLIQDFDPTKADFGVVADHPELIDINLVRAPPNSGRADWMHMNAIDYNEELDQILLGLPFFNEFWVIDHSTTTLEASRHDGGNSGRGGDLLYRWGNPQAYDRGGPGDRRLFNQHHPHWIEPGLPGAGNVLIFNNGLDRPEGDFSSVDEMLTPVDEKGDYPLPLGAAFGPAAALSSYVADPPEEFFSAGLSSAQRLPNGNTLICEGRTGEFFEVSAAADVVWRYVNPVTSAGPLDQGQITGTANNVFRIFRYAPDHPAFAGRDLTPGDPVEGFDRPRPAPAGEGATTPLTASRMSAQGDWIRVQWDVASCPADGYDLFFGDLAEVSGYQLQGGECGIGATGTYDWLAAPPASQFFLVVGVDATGVYESSWGRDGSGAERNGTTPSATCGASYKDLLETCP